MLFDEKSHFYHIFADNENYKTIRYEDNQCTQNHSKRRFGEDIRHFARARHRLLQLAKGVPLFTKGYIQDFP